MRCRHSNSRRSDGHSHLSVPNQWNPGSIVQSHRSIGCPRWSCCSVPSIHESGYRSADSSDRMFEH
ncbi:uncharacterized protein [Blastocystis hominis]|uniref:Uncharacterized protein n=1 Tax=Blastocystis hominis TaxID=12968 RepID=D8M5E9_BLAHO|nr:uncharacterized protein [Blastocystis hominis]CBK23288.2 unnamed protein product [Blastocystis hominis]|eukprot:XP_012897336.1 uncharacterized protein [Blastocystis hominis]